MRTYQSKTVDCQPLQIENKIMNNSFATWAPKGLKLLAHSGAEQQLDLDKFWPLAFSCILWFLKTIVLRNLKKVGHLNSFQMWGKRSCFRVPVTFFRSHVKFKRVSNRERNILCQSWDDPVQTGGGGGVFRIRLCQSKAISSHRIIVKSLPFNA